MRGAAGASWLDAAGQFGFDTAIHYVGERGPDQLPHAQFEAVGLLEDLQSRELDPDDLELTT